MPEIRFGGFDLVLVRAFDVGEKKTKRQREEARKVAVITARLNFDIPYRVIGDLLSSLRRRVNQTENYRPAFLELRLSPFRPSITRNLTRHKFVCFTGLNLAR